MLSDTDKILLSAVSSALNHTDFSRTVEPGEVKDLFVKALHHNVWPIVLDGIMQNHACQEQIPDSDHRVSFYKKYARDEIITQAQRTAGFLLLYDYLNTRGLHPVVLKGIVCRSLYPNPEHRPSADEDLLIEPARFPAYHQALLEYGLELVDPNQDIYHSHEVAYQGTDDHLYIEVHKSLFSPDSEAYGTLNLLFDGAVKRAVPISIYGVPFLTLQYTDHLLYLLLHAFKHFLHSGFGIRQVCDVIIFSERFHAEIDWNYLHQQLEHVRAFDFSRAVYQIGNSFLFLDNHMTDYLKNWNIAEIDETPLLEDIMDSGIYGASSMTRLHSSNMTLSAMAGKKQPILRTLFPSRNSMIGRYPYVKRFPFLLPIAWIQRGFLFLVEILTHRGKSDLPTQSVRLGNQRILLLKRYHIIQDNE